MLKYVAVEGMTLQIVNGSPSPVQGSIIDTGFPSTKVKVDSKGVILDQHSFGVTNITAPSAGATIPASTSPIGNLGATAQYSKAEGQLMVRADDESGVLSAVPMIPSTPSNMPYPVTFQVRVVNPNQNNTKAE